MGAGHGVRHCNKPQTVYNLTVDGTHTYYVLAGPTSLLVHNCPPYDYGKYPEYHWWQYGRRKWPEPNGTLRDLKGLATDDVNNSLESKEKQALMKKLRKKPYRVVKALNRPRNGVHARVKEYKPATDEGNHRVWMLQQLMEEGLLPEDTPIYVHQIQRWQGRR
ncbi:hypothetical protein [Streptomyces sp. NRRL F-5123]|uniref:hypothetical protein n=1 Tax=Streptomyces sp. NRRL F-5123 TaxID=1463856 RepID=UPI0004E0D068|nr:hypothetical protein [Streptomyces sp. NRRL F-5123]